MHRLSYRLVILAALYVTAGCTATHAPVAPTETQPHAPSVQPTAPAPASAPVAVPAPVPAPIAAPIGLSPTAQPHIALLLPLKSEAFEKAATVVEQGFIAASKAQPGALPIRIYACSDESKEVAALYRQAVANGAQAVVGPLTPAGVAALATQSIPVPTLALNRAEIKAPEKFYFFGLVLENEARQAARLASVADLHSAIIVTTDTPLSKRLVQAFTDEWKKQGGSISATKIFNGDNAIFADLPIDPGNMVFVAANAEKARMFRPFINPMLPVYSTSQVFNGNADTLVNYDLRDIVFLDMPWLLQQDHAVVMRYQRANPPLETDMERLYALGIDAYRLVRIMLDGRQQTAMPMDGVTGTIRLNPNHQFDREAVLAEFKQGMGLTPEAQAQLRAAKRAAAAASAPAVTDPVEGE